MPKYKEGSSPWKWVIPIIMSVVLLAQLTYNPHENMAEFTGPEKTPPPYNPKWENTIRTVPRKYKPSKDTLEDYIEELVQEKVDNVEGR